MVLPDSGARQKFATGAVRDISEGKGRCDLLPLDTIEQLLSDYKYWCDTIKDSKSSIPSVFESINLYLETGGTSHLSNAICRFIDEEFKGDIYGALIELSKHYEDGAKKYSPNNWKLGINVHHFINSTIRHYLKYLRGDTDEPHNRAVLWNLVGAFWTHDHHPELNDILEQGGQNVETRITEE